MQGSNHGILLSSLFCVAHLSGRSTEMHSIVYTSARLEQQRIVREEAEKNNMERENNMFGDDDFE